MAAWPNEISANTSDRIKTARTKLLVLGLDCPTLLLKWTNDKVDTAEEKQRFVLIHMISFSAYIQIKTSSSR
jgi:hypothetical protein